MFVLLLFVRSVRWPVTHPLPPSFFRLPLPLCHSLPCLFLPINPTSKASHIHTVRCCECLWTAVTHLVSHLLVCHLWAAIPATPLKINNTSNYRMFFVWNAVRLRKEINREWKYSWHLYLRGVKILCQFELSFFTW